MKTADVVGIVIGIVVVLALVLGAVRILGSRRALRERFGPEYDNVVREKGGRAAAEAELRRRTREHARLNLRDIPEADRARFREEWSAVQARFVDDPAAAVRDADRLIAEIVAERGYPVVEFGQRVEHLSVEHTAVLDDYRAGHAIAVRNDAGRASTEELRQALVHYRSVFADVVGDGVPAPVVSGSAGQPLVPPDGEGGNVDALAPDRGAGIYATDGDRADRAAGDGVTESDRIVASDGVTPADRVAAADGLTAADRAAASDGVTESDRVAVAGGGAAPDAIDPQRHHPELHEADDADASAAQLDTDERVNGADPADDPAASVPRRRR